MFSSGPLLSDGVVNLRPLRWDDVPAHLAGEDEELVRWFDGGHGNQEGVEDYVRSCIDQWRAGGPLLTFGICVSGVLMGSLEVHLDQPGVPEGQADIAYGLYPHGRGHGYATRAVLLGCEFLLGHPEITRALIRVDPLNGPSVAVAVRCGFLWSHRKPAYLGGYDCYYRDLSAVTLGVPPGWVTPFATSS